MPTAAQHPCRALEAELAVVKANFGAALDKLHALGGPADLDHIEAT